MDINSSFPSNFLKAADLQGAQPTVTMAEVRMEDIGDDRKPVLYFEGKDKGIVLNKTNATNIATAYGSETDNWRGKRVTLFTAWVDFQGRSVEAIRVRPARNEGTSTSKPSQAPSFASHRDDPGFEDSSPVGMDDIPF